MSAISKPVEFERKSTAVIMPIVEKRLGLIIKRTRVGSLYRKIHSPLAFVGCVPGLNVPVALFELTLVGALSFNTVLENFKRNNTDIRKLSDADLKLKYLDAIRRKDRNDGRVMEHAEHLTVSKTHLDDNFTFLTQRTQKMSDRYEQMSVNEGANMSDRKEYKAPSFGTSENAKRLENFFKKNYNSLQQIDNAEFTLYSSYLRKLREMKQDFNETPAKEEKAGRELSPTKRPVVTKFTVKKDSNKKASNREILNKIDLKIREVKTEIAVDYSVLKKDLEEEDSSRSEELAQKQFNINEEINKYEKEVCYRIETREHQIHVALAIFRLTFIGSSLALAYYLEEKADLDRYEAELRGRVPLDPRPRKGTFAKMSPKETSDSKKKESKKPKKGVSIMSNI